MRARRRRDVHRVDLRVVDQRFRVGVPPRHAVPLGVVGRLLAVRRMTATSALPVAFCNAGPLFISVTSPQPMMPQRIAMAGQYPQSPLFPSLAHRKIPLMLIRMLPSSGPFRRPT